jgi:hypothetical protein
MTSISQPQMFMVEHLLKMYRSFTVIDRVQSKHAHQKKVYYNFYVHILFMLFPMNKETKIILILHISVDLSEKILFV